MKLPVDEVRRRQRTQSGVLRPEEVALIKWRLSEGESARVLAKDFDVSLWTIRAIARGDTWGWVEPAAGRAELVQPESESFKATIAASQQRLAQLMEEATQARVKDTKTTEMLNTLATFGVKE